MPAPNSIVSEVREALAMRLRAGSCVGAVFGVLLCLGGSVLLWYNEGVAVRTARSLDEAMKHLSSAGAADAAEGALVHASGGVTAQVLRDDQFGLSPLEAVSLERVVEVRQWKESSRKHTRTGVVTAK